MQTAPALTSFFSTAEGCAPHGALGRRRPARVGSSAVPYGAWTPRVAFGAQFLAGLRTPSSPPRPPFQIAGSSNFPSPAPLLPMQKARDRLSSSSFSWEGASRIRRPTFAACRPAGIEGEIRRLLLLLRHRGRRRPRLGVASTTLATGSAIAAWAPCPRNSTWAPPTCRAGSCSITRLQGRRGARHCYGGSGARPRTDDARSRGGTRSGSSRAPAQRSRQPAPRSRRARRIWCCGREATRSIPFPASATGRSSSIAPQGSGRSDSRIDAELAAQEVGRLQVRARPPRAGRAADVRASPRRPPSTSSSSGNDQIRLPVRFRLRRARPG